MNFELWIVRRRLYFKEDFLFVQEVQKDPADCCDSYSVDYRCPYFREHFDKTAEKEFCCPFEVYHSSGKVYRDRIHPDDHEEESPFPEVPDINYQVEHGKEQHA